MRTPRSAFDRPGTTAIQRHPGCYDRCTCGEVKVKKNSRCAGCRKRFRRQIEQPDDPSYRLIALTKGKVAKVDAEDYERVLAVGLWYASRNKKGYYAAWRGKLPNGDKVTLYMHRLVLGLSHGNSNCGDHALHDTLDNRKMVDGKENLRVATSAENARNSTGRRSVSGLKGAILDARDGAWYSQITVNGRCLNLGRFKSAEDAHAAYCVASALHHGKFAAPSSITSHGRPGERVTSPGTGNCLAAQG